MIKMTPIIPIFLDSEPTISGEGNFYFLEYLEFKLFRFNLNAYIQLDHENEEIPHQFQERSEKIQEICGLLEHLYPKLYVHVSRQLKITLRTELIICDIFRCFCRTLFKTGIRWPRIMALFAFASGLVLDCIREGRPEFSRTVVYCMKAFIEDNLAGWVKDQGGWVGVIKMSSSLFLSTSCSQANAEERSMPGSILIRTDLTWHEISRSSQIQSCMYYHM